MGIECLVMNSSDASLLAANAERESAERSVLRVISQLAPRSPDRAELLRVLSGYRWIAGDHRVIYEVLVRSRSASAVASREELPALAARIGFPDIDWDSFFLGESVASENLTTVQEVANSLLRHVPVTEE